MRLPNILLIMADEHNAGVLGCYGNSLIHTPNLDQLARRGIVFENAYTTAPQCVPSRLSFTAGKYPSRVGAWNNECRLPSDAYPSLPRLLHTAGYETYLCGKMHYDAEHRYGFTEIGGNMNTAHKSGRGGRRDPDDLTPQPGVSPRFAQCRAGEGPGMAHDRRVTATVTDFLSRRGRGDAPFLLLAGYRSPHFPLVVPEEYWTAYRGKVPLPEIPAGHLESQPLNYQHLRLGFHLEAVPPMVARRARELYYGLTQWLDEQIGQVLRALAASAVAEETVVIYTADHGENLGEHGLWWKNCMYDSSVRVPLIFSWPARWRGNQRRAGACSLLDLVQTIAGLAGATPPADWNGRSLCPWLDDAAYPWQPRAVAEYYAHHIASGFAMLREGQYKYVYHTPANAAHPAERELYDLQADPGELHNLAGCAAEQERVARLHAALAREIGEDPDESERRCREALARGY